MEIDRAREDVLVAGTAAGTTVALALASRFASPEIGVVGTLAPVFVYFAYLFTRKGGPYGAWDTARNWAVLAVLVGLVALAVTVVPA